MPQSLARMITHVIFSTKHRRPSISPEVRDRLNAYLGGILKTLDCAPIKINSASDHVHILCCLSKNVALAKVVEEVKKGSSKWIKTQGDEFGQFYWQAGYGASSVSQSQVRSVSQYIAGQQEHHRKMTFKEEFRAFLTRHRIEYDERYVWD